MSQVRGLELQGIDLSIPSRHTLKTCKTETRAHSYSAISSNRFNFVNKGFVCAIWCALIRALTACFWRTYWLWDMVSRSTPALYCSRELLYRGEDRNFLKSQSLYGGDSLKSDTSLRSVLCQRALKLRIFRRTFYLGFLQLESNC